jgi:hypothetical protein
MFRGGLLHSRVDYVDYGCITGCYDDTSYRHLVTFWQYGPMILENRPKHGLSASLVRQHGSSAHRECAESEACIPGLTLIYAA